MIKTNLEEKQSSSWQSHAMRPSVHVEEFAVLVPVDRGGGRALCFAVQRDWVVTRYYSVHGVFRDLWDFFA